MKRLREKKFFGILSIVDIAIITFILLIAAPMLYYYVQFNDKGFIQQKALERFIAMKTRQDVVLGTGARTKQLDVDVSFKNLTNQMLARIKKGDRDIDIDGTVMAEVLWIGEPVPNYFFVDTGNVNRNEFVKTVREESLCSLSAKIRLLGVVATNGGMFSHRDKSVRELEMLRFKCPSYEAYFVIEGPLVQKN